MSRSDDRAPAAHDAPAARAEIRIRRTDGSRSVFTVGAGEYTTILDALEEIRTVHDRSLMYRHSCHHGSCGTCGIIANGERVLACTTRITSDEPLDLDPLAPFPLIGDLAVDATPLYADFPADASYLRDSDARPNATDPVAPGEVGRFTRFENCIECGICVSVCPVVRPFKGPAALAAYGREIAKRPDREDELLSQIDAPDGVAGCDRALNCSAACPLGVYPAKHIAVLTRKIDARRAD